MADHPGDETPPDTDADEQDSESDDGAVPPGTVELLAFLDAQYGGRFDADRRDQLRDSVAGLRENGEALREADLENGDEPAFTFAAYRGEE